jgi:hypothetical protein
VLTLTDPGDRCRHSHASEIRRVRSVKDGCASLWHRHSAAVIVTLIVLSQLDLTSLDLPFDLLIINLDT